MSPKGLFSALLTLLVAASAVASGLPPGVRILFGDEVSLEQELVQSIEGATTEILFSQHAVTNPRVAEAIVRAFQVRKLYVAGVLDRNPPVRNYTTPEYFAVNRIPVVVLAGSNHARYVVIDRQIVVVGSADWTNSGLSRTNDNLFIVSEPSIAAVYREKFILTFGSGTVVQPPSSRRNQPTTPKDGEKD